MKEIVIPELDEIAKTYAPDRRPWTDDEKAIVAKYYGRVPPPALMKYLPDRSCDAVRIKAAAIGMRRRSRDLDPP